MSVVSIWEVQIKIRLGKLKLRDSLPGLVDQQHRVNGFGLLAVHVEHVFQLDELETHHKDPPGRAPAQDRLLIAQALYEDLTLVTRDGVFEDYGVSLLW